MFKIILATISATVVIIFFVLSIFFNGILGLFNLATIPLNLLPEFHQSKQIITELTTKNKKLNSDNKGYKQKNSRLKKSNKAYSNKINTIKARHQTKNLNISKKFVERTGKKITSSAIAAGTIGTVGVVFTLAGLEAYYYCEDKQELFNDENILFDINKKFDYEACLNEARKDSEKIVTLVKESLSKEVNNAWDRTKSFSQEQWQKVIEESNNVWQKTRGFSKDQWQNIKINADYIWRQTNYGVKEYLEFLKNKYKYDW